MAGINIILQSIFLSHTARHGYAGITVLLSCITLDFQYLDHGHYSEQQALSPIHYEIKSTYQSAFIIIVSIAFYQITLDKVIIIFLFLKSNPEIYIFVLKTYLCLN